MFKIATACMLLLAASSAHAWDGYDSDSGTSVQIDKGNLVRAGQDIEIYDHDSGEYKDVSVESVRSSGSGAEVEVYDHGTGEYRTLEIE